MQHKKGIDRSQLFFTSLEEMVSADSFARVIDVVVEMLPLEDLGFVHAIVKHEGNEPYHPADLLKLLIYGQRYGIRSANRLSKSTLINAEARWLLNSLTPSPRTICYFRTNNLDAIKKAHRHFVKMFQKWNMIDGELMALDSTKVRGQNSLKNNFNQKKIDRHLKYLDGKIVGYLERLEALENHGGSSSKKEEIMDRIEDAEERVDFYQELEGALQNSPDGQISSTDPDARAVIKHRNIVEVGYYIQTMVDAKNQMIVDVFAGGVTDRGDLGEAAKRSQDLLGVQKIDLLADKGYHNGADVAYCERKGIRTFIPPSNQHHQKEVGFRKMDFVYDPDSDTYLCPDGQVLTFELTYKKKNNRRNYRVKRYGTSMCEGCPLRSKFTTSAAGRKIERPNHQPHVERNNARVARYPDYYRLRQQIVEPIFGVWKRQWHFDHVMLKTRAKVEMEVSLAALTYNLMRLLAVKGVKWMKDKLNKSAIIESITLLVHEASKSIKMYFNLLFTCNVMTPYIAKINGQKCVVA